MAGSSTPTSSAALVQRWPLHARLAHGGLAVGFLGLLASGLALGQPELRGIPFLGSKLFREVHLTFAILLVVLPAIPASWDGYRHLAGVWREARRLAPADRRWLCAVVARSLGRPADLPEQGRLNAGQKLNVLAVVGLLGALALTGTAIAPEAGRPIPQPIREAVYEVHVLLAFAIIPLIAGHLFLALLFRPTRPSLRGALLGTVSADWARRHHARWLNGADS